MRTAVGRPYGPAHFARPEAVTGAPPQHPTRQLQNGYPLPAWAGSARRTTKVAAAAAVAAAGSVESSACRWHHRRSDHDDDRNEARLTDFNVVQGCTASNLWASTDHIPYPMAGTPVGGHRHVPGHRG